MVLSNPMYDKLKWIAQYLLPALATLWIALAKVWNFPYGTEIGATLTAIDLFLGGILGVSSKNYKGDGNLVINEDDPEKDIYSLELNVDLAELADKSQVTFKVNK